MLNKEKLLNDLKETLAIGEEDVENDTSITICSIMDVLISRIENGEYDDEAYKDLLEDYKKLEEAYNFEIGCSSEPNHLIDNPSYKVDKSTLLAHTSIGKTFQIDLPTFKKD